MAAMPAKKKPTTWPPPAKPESFEFSLHRDGWAKWYKGQTRVIPLKSLDRGAVRDAWEVRKKEIDADRPDQPCKLAGGRTPLREAAGAFYEFLDHRVETGKPKKLSDRQREDYKRAVGDFGRCVGADRPVASFTQDDFKKFAEGLSGYAPSTFARAVANLRGFFNWCVEESYLHSKPKFGSYFTRPAAEEHRDARMSREKSYTPAEIAKLWEKASPTDRCWIALGLNGGLDNADIANLPMPAPGGILDLDAGMLDYRRRKVGKARRIIPLRPETVKLIREHLATRHAPPAGSPHADRLFLTPDGFPLGRLVESKKRPGRFNPVDAVARRWQRLMVKAGLRAAPTVTTTGKGEARVRRLKFAGDADGRGFRSLRTTFPNLAPAVGYRDEVEIVMGHLQKSVLVEHYLERFGTDRLRELVDAVWSAAFTLPPPRGAAGARKAGAGGKARAARPAAGKRKPGRVPAAVR